MAKATSSQAWLWHRHLSHLNFDTINLLSKNDIVVGLPKVKFVKDHLCSSYELGKAKRKSFHTKLTPSSKRRLQLLHMDLCGPMQTMALNHDSLSPTIQCQTNVSQADRTVKMSNELDLLFSPMFDELLNGSSKVVLKSFTVSAADAINQRQQYSTPLNNHTTPAPTCLIPTLAPTIISSENINQAELNAENDQVTDDEFINIFSTPVQDQGEMSSRHVDSSNMHTFYQRYPYTWTHFLRSKDETPEVLIDFLRLVQGGLQAQVIVVRTDKGTEFMNQTLHAYFAAEGIQHQTSVARTPEQNGVVERRNRTLVEAARTMLSAAKVPLFFWAEAIATACFTQNRSLVIPRHEKTPYHIINELKPSVKFFHIFGSVCYIVRDGENLDKMKEKGDECIFVGYSTQSRAYRVFNKRTRVIMESIHVNFDELPQMASVQDSSDPAPTRQSMASVQDSSDPAPTRQSMASVQDSSDPAPTRQSTTLAHNSSNPAPTCQTMASVQISFDPAPECQTMVLKHSSLSPGRKCQENDS
nr:retrovirus-related Pol polyprotein from transposon TNT 1-94 [Tanacetum cinerariifolium]